MCFLDFNPQVCNAKIDIFFKCGHLLVIKNSKNIFLWLKECSTLLQQMLSMAYYIL